MSVGNLAEHISRVTLHRIQTLADTIQIVRALAGVYVALVVERQNTYQLADIRKNHILGADGIDTAVLVRLECRTGGIALVDAVAGNRIRRIHKHLPFALLDKCKIRQRRHNGKTAAAGTEYRRNLRDHAGSRHLSRINLSESVKRVHGLLQTDSRTVDETDDRSSHLHRHIVDRRYLLCMHLADCAVEHRRILAVNKHKTAVNQPVSCDHTVGRCVCPCKIKIRTSCGYKRTGFHETVLVDQPENALHSQTILTTIHSLCPPSIICCCKKISKFGYIKL